LLLIKWGRKFNSLLNNITPTRTQTISTSEMHFQYLEFNHPLAHKSESDAQKSSRLQK